MSKTVLAVWHSGGKGKTESIKEFAKTLLVAYPDHEIKHAKPKSIPIKGDFRLVVKIDEIVIGIESKGDPHTGLKERLNDLAKTYNCDIIVCTCRTRGETVTAVESLGFQTIWTSTYQVNGLAEQAIANSLKGKHILELLQALKLI